MAVVNYQTHATMFDTFAPDVLNSLQINLLPTAVHSPKPAEKWLQARETFHDQCCQVHEDKNMPNCVS